ncbi:MAG: queuosine salvage family protein [Methanocellales archaeon]
MRVKIDREQCFKLARAIKGFKFKVDEFKDPLLFPPHHASPEEAANFFFFMVAIDHRTRLKFEGVIEGKKLHGSELLYALARRRMEYFTAEKMKSISKEEVANWLSLEESSIPDPEVRAMLLRDSAIKLLKHYRGSALELIKTANGYLMREDGEGLLQLLAQFKAYSDPLSKKSFLLVKFLERRKLFKVIDIENLHIPVDNILARIALRTGIIEVMDEKLKTKLKKNLPANQVDDREIRSIAQKAYDMVSKESRCKVTLLDDVFWTTGRACCSRENPVCFNCRLESCRASHLLGIECKHSCIFTAGCRGAENLSYRAFFEPNFKTWYY